MDVFIKRMSALVFSQNRAVPKEKKKTKNSFKCTLEDASGRNPKSWIRSF
jgi:hypothetical protein